MLIASENSCIGTSHHGFSTDKEIKEPHCTVWWKPGFTDLLPTEMHFTSKHKICHCHKDKENVFLSLCISSKEAPCVFVIRRTRSNLHLRVSRNRYTHTFRNSSQACSPSDAQFIFLLCLREFSQFVQDNRKRQSDRERLDVPLLHFSPAPRGFCKAFSKKHK